MKATKKIVGAACALVAAVALSAGSTFAWFASNSEVTATGMHVQATVPTNLYIEKGYITSADGVNKTTISITSSADALNPAAVSKTAATGATISATSGSVTDKLYVVEAATYETDQGPTSSSSGTVATYGARGTLTPATSGSDTGAVWEGEAKTADAGAAKYAKDDYIYTADMTLANKSKAADIDATITIGVDASLTSVSSTISFLRIGFLIGETDGTDWTYSYVTEANDITIASSSITTGTKYVYDSTAKTVTVEFAKLIENFDSNSVRTVTILVWFDGDDTDCFVNNALSVNEFNISAAFEAKAITSPTP